MLSESRNRPDNKDRIAADLELVREIVAGSRKAWHKFLELYSDLIHQVVRRHLFSADEEDVRTVHVDVLKALYDGEMSRYDPRSKLSTWLIVFTRSRALDYFRKCNGRYRLPVGYQYLSDPDRRVLRLYYTEHLPIEIVIHMLCWEGYNVDADFLVGSIQRIEKLIDRRYLKRQETQHRVRMNHTVSADALKYLVYLRSEQEKSGERNRPDTAVLEQEVQNTAKRLRELIENLPDEEQKVINLRFRHRWTARRIAQEMALGSQRRAYTLIDRVIRKLREQLKLEPDDSRTL
jgi:RNA polymerase sigma factor (sigma-70 family)